MRLGPFHWQGAVCVAEVESRGCGHDAIDGLVWLDGDGNESVRERHEHAFRLGAHEGHGDCGGCFTCRQVSAGDLCDHTARYIQAHEYALVCWLHGGDRVVEAGVERGGDGGHGGPAERALDACAGIVDADGQEDVERVQCDSTKESVRDARDVWRVLEDICGKP